MPNNETISVNHFIDGESIRTAKSLRRVSPVNAAKIFRVSVASRELVANAVGAANRARAAWQATSVDERARVLSCWSGWLLREYGEAGEATRLKQLIHECMGKPIAEADVEVVETSDFIAYFSGLAVSTLSAEEPALDQNLWATKRSVVLREPYGIVAIIKPWNYPLEMVAWSVVPALLAGNTVVIKPSEKAAAVASEFAKMALDSGLPPGVLNIVHGDGRIGRHLVEHPDVDYVSFTGSVSAGKEIARRCSERLAPYSLELGGNDAAIVLEDADIELAANGLAWGAFCNAGQVCVGTKRAFVDERIYGKLVKALEERVVGIRPLEDVGPIVDQHQLASITSFVKDCTDRGAKAHAGRTARNNALYYPPTILTNVSEDSRIMMEECFGPVLPIVPFKTVDEAIERANASKYGLGASVWSSDHLRAKSIASRLDVGMVWINDVNVAFPQAPWGGSKSSGSSFELGSDAVRKFTRPKHICDETSDDARRSWWYPY